MPTQEFASSNLAQVRYIEESEYGVTPTTGNPNNLRMTGESLAFSISKTESGEIISDRQTADLIETGASAAGGINIELSYREFDVMFRAMLMAPAWEVYGVGGVGESFQATTTASTIVAAAAPTGTSAFTGLKAGQWFQFRCPGSVNDKKFLKVHATIAPTTASITVDPATPLVADATAKASTLSASRISNGVTKKSFTFERAHNDVSQFFPFTGMVPSKLSLSLASGSILTGSMEFMGKRGARNNASIMPGTPIASQNFEVMNAVSGLGQLLEGGVALTATKIKKLDLSLDNTLRGQDAIGERGNANIGLGTVKVTGTMEVYLADGSMYDKFLNNTKTSLQFVLCDGSKNGYAFTIAAMKFGDAKIQAGSKDSDCMLSIPFTGIRDTVSGKTIFMDRMGVASDYVEPVDSKAEINTAPSVNGTPQVGTPLAITSGTFKNANPTATVIRTIYSGGTLVATASGYTPVAADVGKTFTVVDTATNRAGSTANMSANSAVCIAAGSPSAIGPYTVGSTIETGGGRSYLVTAGDDFNEPVSVIGPGTPLGKYSPTRSYMGLGAGNGPRTNTGSLALKGADMDHLHTGLNDANRGVAVSTFSDLIQTTGGRLKLKSRTASVAERAMFPTDMPNASAMINTAATMLITAPFVLESRMALTRQQPNMRGWHPTFWAQQVNNVGSYNGTEIDFEATSLHIQSNRFAWNGNGSTQNGGPLFDYLNGVDYTYRFEILADGTLNFYSNQANGGGDTALSYIRQIAGSAGVADVTRPFQVMFTNHTADFGGDPYVDADWVAAGSAGAIIDVAYYAAMTPTGVCYQPKIAHQTYNVDHGAAIDINLPTATDLWGGAVTENIESWAQESNEPGGDGDGGYRLVPPGMTYDLAALKISGTPAITSTKPKPDNKAGRLMVVRYTSMPGSACVPHRTIINIGPRWTVTALPNVVVGTAYSYDLYAKADCGVLVSDANGNRTKTIAVSGLPAGLSYNDSTGLITGTPTAAFSGNVTATVTNSVGQTKQAALALTVTAANTGTGVAPPVLTGSPTIRNSWDFDKGSTLTMDTTANPPIISAVAPSDGGTLTLSNDTPASSPTRVLRPNNRYAAKFDKAFTQNLRGVAPQGIGGSQILIFEPVTSSAAAVVFDRANSASAATANREQLLLNGSVNARRSGSGGTTDVTMAGGNALSTLHVAVVTFDPAGTAITVYIDGMATPGTGNGAAPTTMGTVTMGARTSSSTVTAPLDGYIYRVIDYPVVLTAEQADQAAVWAAANYGTPNLA